MSPIDELIDAALTGAPDPVIAGLVEAAQRDIATRHAAQIRSDVNPDRCTITITITMADGTERRLI